MTIKEKIREACIKANPEIMELKFGCIVQSKSDEKHYAIYTGVVVEGKEKHASCVEYKMFNKWNGETIGHWNEGGFTIIDRTIHLADVLLVVDYSNFKIKDGWVYLGSAMQTKFWNLKDDNLENQSKETLQFIANLL